jgi:hypothetical protein
MQSITETTQTEQHGNLVVPIDPWAFAKAIERNQSDKNRCWEYHTILFNKGRYFETTIRNNKILNEVSELIKSPVQYNNMIVDNWKKLEDFVIAMNCLGIYVLITVDWI